MPVLNMFGVPLRHCINGITKNDKINIDLIPSLNERIENLEDEITNIKDWTMITNPTDFRYLINDNHIVNKDMIIRIGSDGYNDITLDKTIYLPKGFKFKDTNNSINVDFIDLSNLKLYSMEINESEISDSTNTISLIIENWDFSTSIGDDETITFNKVSIDNETPFFVIYVRGE